MIRINAALITAMFISLSIATGSAHLDKMSPDNGVSFKYLTGIDSGTDIDSVASDLTQPWDVNNFSPTSRTLYPQRVVPIANTAPSTSQEGVIFPRVLQKGAESLVLDFGKEVGGYTTVQFGKASGGAQTSFAWSESTYYIQGGDHSNGGSGPDGLLSSGDITTGSNWTAAGGQLRGGFRYLHIALQGGTDASVEIVGVSLAFTAAPNWGPDPSKYLNHFHSSDDVLNKVWYGCAYTVQLCSIQAEHGRQWPPPKAGWANNATCGIGTSILVDGAKRDRVIWPGDMGVSTATAFATTGDTYSSQMSIETLFQHQLPNGMLPYAGPPVSFYGNSDTYHLWALIGTTNLFSHTGNTTWLKSVWSGFTKGLGASISKIGKNGLMVVTAGADWARSGQGGRKRLIRV